MKKIVSIIVISFLSVFIMTTLAQSDVVVWKFETGGIIYATPVLRDSVLYFGSHDQKFYAVNVKTGNEIWSYVTDNEIYTTAALYEDIVCFKSGNILYGLDLQGNFLWRDTLYHGSVLNEHDYWDYFHSSPVLADSIAYIGSEVGLVFGVNVKTGEKVFECQTPLSNHTIETTPAIYNGKIYVGDWDGVFCAFNLSNGELAWQHDTKDDNTYSWVNAIQTNPVIYNDDIYFAGRSCNLYSLDPETGAVNWTYHDPGDMWLLGGPAIADSVLYLGSSNQHVLRAFNAITGEQKWECGVDYRIFGTPLVDEDYIFVGTGSETSEEVGSLIAIDKASGEKIDMVAAGGQVHSSPVLNDSVIYFGSADHYMYAVHKQKMLNVPRADTYIESEDTVYLGDLPSTGTFDTIIYIYNKGEISDSITAKGSRPQVTVDPPVFDLAPMDSQAIAITIDPSDLSPKTYTVYALITSNRSAFTDNFRKYFNFTVSGVTGSEAETVRGKLISLSRNYPNPVSQLTNIDYNLANKYMVDLKVYDLTGREVATLVNEVKLPGFYTVSFDASGLADGIYFYNFNAGATILTGKMIIRH